MMVRMRHYALVAALTLAAVGTAAGQDANAAFGKQLKDVIKHAETGFKAIKGDERDTNAKSIVDPVDDYDRFASKLKVDGATAQEILAGSGLTPSKDVSFVAYFSSNRRDEHSVFDQLLAKVKAGLGDGYVSNMTYAASDIDDDSEGKAAEFSLKNSKVVLLKVVLADDISQFDIVKTKVRLVVPSSAK